MTLTYQIAKSADNFNDARELFTRYSKSLNIDLSFQNFAQELSLLETQYNKPSGALLLCYDGGIAIACVACRLLEPGTGELKRMYVNPDYRGRRIGEELLIRILDIARDLGYEKVRLDTLPTMHAAIKLYRSFHFYEIDPYRFNPVKGTVYMECVL